MRLSKHIQELASQGYIRIEDNYIALFRNNLKADDLKKVSRELYNLGWWNVPCYLSPKNVMEFKLK